MLKNSARMNVLAMVLLLAACGGGDNSAEDGGGDNGGDSGRPKGALVWLEGDTVYETELKIHLPANLDHSSPNAIVEAYMGMQDFEQDPKVKKQGKEIDKKFGRMVDKELSRLEKKLLTDEQHTISHEERLERLKDRPRRYESESTKPEIVDEQEQDDGSVMVETKSVRTTRHRESEDDEWEEDEPEEMRKRFYCVKEGDKWYIDRIETGWKRPDTEEWNWREDSSDAVRIKLQAESRDDPIGKAPKMKNSTPKEAAESLLTLVRLEGQFRDRMLGSMFEYIGDQYAPAFSKGAHEKAKEELEKDGEENEPEPEVGNVSRLSDTESEVEVQVPNYRGEMETAIIRVRKEGDSWKVYAVGEKRGGEFRAYANVYRLG